MRLPIILLLLSALSLTTSCLQGPRAFRASHAQHNEALRARIDEELLLNLVRLRYRDSPLFLQVGSVVSQFQMSSSLGLDGKLNESAPGSLGLSTGLGWQEKPTYTFTPLQDDEFVRRLLTPMDLEVVVLLQRSGWSIDRVLRLTVENLGGLENASSASGPTPSVAPVFSEFVRVSKALRRLQREGHIQLAFEEQRGAISSPVQASSVLGADVVQAAQSGYRFDPAEGNPSQLVLTQAKKKPLLYVSASAHDSLELQEIENALGLTHGLNQFDIVVGGSTGEPGAREPKPTLGVSTRSLLGTLFYLSQGIDIPTNHIEQGLVTVTRDADNNLFDWSQLTGDLFRVRSSSSRPAEAAIAVPYRGHWFYVEDADLESKSSFSLLLELFNMSAEVPSGAAPALTLPIGG